MSVSYALFGWFCIGPHRVFGRRYISYNVCSSIRTMYVVVLVTDIMSESEG